MVRYKPFIQINYIKEIGEELNISEGTSKWYLSEARKKLQTLFNTSLKDIKYGQ